MSPESHLTWGNDGNLYGTTRQGGFGGASGTNGTIFKVTPSGVITTLTNLNFTNDGAQPWKQPFFWRTTEISTAQPASGVSIVRAATRAAAEVFRLSTNGVLTTPVLLSHKRPFREHIPPRYPKVALLQTAGGKLLGTASVGGSEAKPSTQTGLPTRTERVSCSNLMSALLLPPIRYLFRKHSMQAASLL